MQIKTLGLIAGNGKFPILFAREAKAKDIKVIAAGIRGDTSLFLKPFTDEFNMFKVGELKKMFEFFRLAGVKEVIMAGQVNQKNLFDEKLDLDEEFQALYDALKDRKADTIFSAIANKLRENGLELIDSTFLLEDYLAPKGTLTKRGPTTSELEAIEFGQKIAKDMGAIDVGQTVVVKEKAIVAIEAMEGTDQTILRGGRIAKKGAVVVKTSKPGQDLRFDVPVIGPRTIAAMKKSGADCLAIESGKTIVIDCEKCVALANKSKICIVGV